MLTTNQMLACLLLCASCLGGYALGQEAGSRLTFDTASSPAAGELVGQPTEEAPTNHLVRFIGLKHEQQNQDVARQMFVAILNRIIPSESVVVTEFNDRQAVWFSRNISSLPGCPKDQILKLMAQIKAANSDEYTRLFKMELTENFRPPDDVQLEWLGPCENEGRKRSQVLASSALPGDNTLDAALPGEQDNRQSEQNVSSVSSSSSSSGWRSMDTEEAELTRPTTSTQAPSSTPEPETQAPEEATSAQPPATVPTEAPDLQANGGNLFAELGSPNLTDINMMFDEMRPTSTTTERDPTTKSLTTIATQDRPPETTTTTEAPITTTTTTRATLDEAPKTTTVGSSKFAEPGGFPSDEAELTESLMTRSQAAAGGPGAQSQAPEEAMAAKSSTSGDLGKYIGLSTAFVIFVAYLVCSRAYRRQGMYELHNE